MAAHHRSTVWAMSLLASPPSLRSAIARKAFASGASKPLTAPSHVAQGRRLAHSALRRTRASAQSLYVAPQRRMQSSAPATDPSKSPPEPESPSSQTRAAKDRPISPFVYALLSSSVVLFLFVAGTTMAVAPAAETISAWANPPTDEETLTLFEPRTSNTAQINEHIKNHPLAKKLRTEPAWKESRPHMKIPPPMRQHNLTGGTLLGENKIEVPPLTFIDTEAELPRMVQISYLGSGLCGHPGIVHGGLLATMLDEGLARCCFHALPNKVGVTASLKIDYRAPCPGNSYVVLRAETTKVEGRKAWVKGWIELLGEEDGKGTKLVEAEALFVEPKGAKHMARVYSAT